ncbi:T9SS type A sorting domain-containing protein [Polaribacter sp.]|nr:T9SS type A sorting domain-containing protein [Polaribacter sp.]
MISDKKTYNIYFDNIYLYRAATAGVDLNNLLDVSLSPVPAKNELRISAQDLIENVTIYNILGKRVVNATINKKEDVLDVSSLKTGVYILKYTINNAVGTMKFIKE